MNDTLPYLELDEVDSDRELEPLNETIPYDGEDMEIDVTEQGSVFTMILQLIESEIS